jgi:lipopolysaccharide export system ATP-binding protein
MTPVLRGVDLQLSAGSILGVIGPSGAGKSTLFRVLVGERVPDRGRVELLGRDVTTEPLWRRARAGLGYVPQTPSVLLDLSIAGNLRTFERAARVPKGSAHEWASLLGLGQHAGTPARVLSGGERRRLELVRALLARPKVLVCDEPLTGLDPQAVATVGELLRRVAEQGGAVILADHRIREVLPFCDQAALLVDGRVEVVAAPSTFADHEAVQRRYLTA